MRKSGAPVFLMEFVVVLLFFSLSAVVTLQLFVTAYLQERDSVRLSAAMEQAQNTAEIFRAQGRAAFQKGGWTKDRQGPLEKYTYGQEGLILRVELEASPRGSGLLLSGKLQVFAPDKPNADPVYTLPLSRYEPAPEVVP